MNALFLISATVAIVATFAVILQRHAVHALLYLVLSLLAVGLTMFSLGAPFAAALEVIIYAGAIMVLFVFVIMMLNLGKTVIESERTWKSRAAWLAPSALALVLLAELIYILLKAPPPSGAPAPVGPREVGIALFGPYLLGVEIASFLLLSGLVGAYHVAHRAPAKRPATRTAEVRP